MPPLRGKADREGIEGHLFLGRFYLRPDRSVCC